MIDIYELKLSLRNQEIVNAILENLEGVSNAIAQIDLIQIENLLQEITDWKTLNVSTGAEGTEVAYDASTNTLTIPRGNTGAQGVQGIQGIQGEKGDTGDALTITSITNNPDYTLTITFSDGTSHTTGVLRGLQGEQGMQGVQGIQGEQGIKGEKGDSVTNVSSTKVGKTTTVTVEVENNTPFTFDVEDGADGEVSTADLNAGLATKQDTITGAASSVATNNLTANRVVISDASGKITQSDITDTELGYLDGVTSNIQTQLNTKPTKTANETITGQYSFDTTPLDIDGEPITTNRGFKNYIINGDFSIWQRGTSFTTTTGNQYTADRWYTNGGGVLVDKVVRTDGSNFLRIRKGTASIGYRAIIQKVELPKSMSGKVMTLSGKIKLNVACPYRYLQLGWQNGTQIYVQFDQCGIDENNLVDDQHFKTSFVIHSDATDYTYYLCKFSGTGSQLDDFDFELSEVQLEEGSVATPFEQRPYGLELSLCQRYYEEVLHTWHGHYYSFVGGAYNCRWFANGYYNTQKRVIPTISIYDNIGQLNKCSLLDVSGNVIHNGIDAGALSSEHGFKAGSSSSATAFPSTANGLYMKIIADAEL